MNEELKEEVVMIEVDRLVKKGLLKRVNVNGEYQYVKT
jgi:predicted transcriptional regulator